MREADCVYDSDRLVFEPLRARHAAFLFDAMKDPLVYEHLNFGPPASVDELSAEFVRRSAGPLPDRGEERWRNWAVQRKSDGRWIGHVQATLYARWAEVAYVFDPACWGNGYASEALAWLQRYVESQEGVSEFWASVAPANQRSVRLLLRAGYRRVTLSDARPLGSYVMDDEIFRYH